MVRMDCLGRERPTPSSDRERASRTAWARNSGAHAGRLRFCIDRSKAADHRAWHSPTGSTPLSGSARSGNRFPPRSVVPSEMTTWTALGFVETLRCGSHRHNPSSVAVARRRSSRLRDRRRREQPDSIPTTGQSPLRNRQGSSPTSGANVRIWLPAWTSSARTRSCG